jgi:nitrogen fixation/metabolism regulation signal transduction histidine kinase
MSLLEKLITKREHKTRFQDIIFLIGIFLFAAILIIGLFPKSDTTVETGKSFFLYYMMTIPVIAAVYFLVTSFRRKLYPSSLETGSSIRLKIALAFVFVAVLPSLPIILISNNIINNTIAELISEKTSYSLEESISMSKESVSQIHTEVQQELRSLDYLVRRNTLRLSSPQSREVITEMLLLKGYRMLFFRVLKRDVVSNSLLRIDGAGREGDLEKSLIDFLRAQNLGSTRVHNLSIQGNSILLGCLPIRGYLIALYRTIPAKVFTRVTLYEDALRRYKQMEFLKPYFQTGVGIFLLLLAILIILLSIGVSIILSKSITQPVFDLAAAARRVASGDFSVQLERDSPDEMSLLFQSFNRMVMQLNESRRILYETQKLEAWREMAKKLVHEIKNPLTPIRLSAERIRKRFDEAHPEIEGIVQSGTETIIEEVTVLTRMLNEFSRFARLPEMRPELQHINPVIEKCIDFFRGHEGVNFHLDLDNELPPLSFDRALLRQAMTNLIQNAIDAIGVSGNVYVSSQLVEDEGSVIRITIQDDGVGIAGEELEKIFEPTFSTKEKGTGLGLTIVEKIILEHKGRIYCHSVPGVGSDFVIELPIIEREVPSHGEDSHS